MTELRTRVNAFGTTTTGRVVLAVAFALTMLLVAASPSFATHCDGTTADAGTETCPAPAATPVSAANDAISSGVTDATNIVQTNIPLILGVVVAFVALKYGKRLLGKL